MTEKPTTVRISPDIQEELDLYMANNKIKTKSKAINALVKAGLGKQAGGVPGASSDRMMNDYELNNFIQMRAFLQLKKWEAKENEGYAVIKQDDLDRIDEFIACFSNLTHNASLWRVALKDEGYTGFAEVVEEARKFM